MASVVAIPQFINYPGAIQGPMPGPMPPAAVPLNPTFNHSNLSVPTANAVSNFTNAPAPPVPMPIVPVGGGCYNDGMEVVWHGEFSRLFSNFYPSHIWYLTITNEAPQNKWKFHRDSAKVRFCCQDCGNGWTSMKGRVTFWFYLDFHNHAGFVQFKLYGQQCKKCNTGKFEYVMWYPEEVSKVMCNVYNKVGQTYYGFLQPPIRIDRRPGRPRNQHNAELCQACRDGECDQARPIKPVFNMNALVHAPLAIQAPPVVNGGVAPSLQTIPNPSPSQNSPLAAGVQASASMVVNPTCKSPMYASPNNGNVITTPVTLTSGVQPVLTYTVISAPLTSTSLSPTSNQFIPNGPPPPPLNGHYIYHQTPRHIINKASPMPQPRMYSYIPPPKQVIQNNAKPVCQPAPVTSVNKVETNGTETELPVKEDEAPQTPVNLSQENEDVEKSNSTKVIETKTETVKTDSMVNGVKVEA